MIDDPGIRPDKAASVAARPESLAADVPVPDSPPLTPRWRIPGPILGLLVILALFVLLLYRNGELSNFLSLRNLQGLMHECRIPAVVALGMLLIIITGGIDLSVQARWRRHGHGGDDADLSPSGSAPGLAGRGQPGGSCLRLGRRR